MTTIPHPAHAKPLSAALSRKPAATASSGIPPWSPIDLDDYDTREGRTARRNVLFGLWAARRLGLDHDEHQAFAWKVHFADLSEPGHDDVIAAVSQSFREQGVVMSDRALRAQFREMSLRADYDLSMQEGAR